MSTFKLMLIVNDYGFLVLGLLTKEFRSGNAQNILLLIILVEMPWTNSSTCFLM